MIINYEMTIFNIFLKKDWERGEFVFFFSPFEKGGQRGI